MYETPGEPICPVQLYEKYISHLNPMCSRLWQRTRDSYSDEDLVWYQNRPIGKGVTSKFMVTKQYAICVTFQHDTPIIVSEYPL